MARPLVPNRPARLNGRTRLAFIQSPGPAAHAPNAVEVAVGIGRAVVVDHDVHALNIDTTTKDICGDQNTLLERLEGGVAGDTVQI